MVDLRIFERFRNFASRSAFEQLWFLPVWLGLGLASLAISLLEFNRIAWLLGGHCGTTKPIISIKDVQRARALRIRATIGVAERYAPWRADCYPQAIVARCLLGIYRMPYALSMGLKRDAVTGKMLAHAWVESGDVSVCGGKGDEEYRIVAIFSNRYGSQLGEISDQGC